MGLRFVFGIVVGIVVLASSCEHQPKSLKASSIKESKGVNEQKEAGSERKNWLTEQEIESFYAQEGNSSEELRKLFGPPSNVEYRGDSEIWEYPFQAHCEAEINNKGVVVRVFYTAGY